MEEYEGTVHDALHLLGVGHEVGRDVAAVELHAFNHFYGGFGALGFVDGDDAFALYFLHGFGDESADGVVVVCRYACHVLNLLEVVAYFLRLCADAFYHGGYGLVDAALEVHGVGTCGDVLETYADDGLCEHGSGGCAVACVVAGLGCHFLDELGAHVLKSVLEFNLAGNCHAVLGDVGSAELAADDDVAAFRTEGYLDSVGEGVDTFLELVAGFDIEFYFFCHDCMRYNVEEIIRLQRELRSDA